MLQLIAGQFNDTCFTASALHLRFLGTCRVTLVLLHVSFLLFSILRYRTVDEAGSNGENALLQCQLRL